MFLGTIRRLFNRGRLNKNSFSNYYEDILIKDGLVVILIDMQQIFLDGLKKKNRERIIANQIFIIRWCAQENIPVVVLEYRGSGETIDVLAKELKKIEDLRIILKSYDNGFYYTELKDVLEERNAKNLFLMGINASACVKRTAIGAREEGFSIITSNDVIGGNNDDNSISWYVENGIVVFTKGSTKA
ncbi:MAG: isochorismatase family protein [Patescibacteria group bacterium]|nr:isochorismatase family protein [Patescibacteria group bacterium]